MSVATATWEPEPSGLVIWPFSLSTEPWPASAETVRSPQPYNLDPPMAPLDDPRANLGERPPTEAESTVQLLERIQRGDQAALDALFARYLVPLRRWATGRLPLWARNANDTHDLVQDTLLNAFRNLNRFEPRREGAFQAYLRQAVMNKIRDYVRRRTVTPAADTLDEHAHGRPGSQFDDFVGLETLERYEAALSRLSDADREAIIGRVELGNTYEELARALDKPSADAARMTVARALLKLADEMKRVS